MAENHKEINMTKTFRTAALVTVMAMFAAGSAMAQNSGTSAANENSENQLPPGANVPACNHQNFQRFSRAMGPNHHMKGDEKNVLIGQIKSIDTKEGRLKISNADGKDVEIRVSPFTKIMIVDPDNRDPKNPGRNDVRSNKKRPAENMEKSGDLNPPAMDCLKEYSLGDLKKGTWVMVSTFDTSSKTYEASHIIARQKINDVNNTSVMDAK